jgi:FHA domain
LGDKRQVIFVNLVMLDLDAENSQLVEAASPEDDRPPPAQRIPAPGQPAPTDDLLTVERQIAITAPPPDRSAGTVPIAYYVQLIEQATAVTLRTNLPRTDAVQSTEQGMAWLLGRSRNCAIVFPDPAISRCHAVLSYQADSGFQLMDTASSNGTWLNGQRLIAMQPRAVQDGDQITMSHITLQLFIQRSGS